MRVNDIQTVLELTQVDGTYYLRNNKMNKHDIP